MAKRPSKPGPGIVTEDVLRKFSNDAVVASALFGGEAGQQELFRRLMDEDSGMGTKEARPLDHRVRVIHRPRGGRTVPGAEELETKPTRGKRPETKSLRSGTRYVRTAAGVDRYGVGIGKPILPDAPEPGDDRDLYTAYTPDELAQTYGRQRWSQHIGAEGDGYDLRIMNDGDAILTYPNDLTQRDDHVILVDGLVEDGMRDLHATIAAAAERAEEVAGWDEDELAEYVEEYGYSDDNERFIDIFETQDHSMFFGVDKTGDVGFGFVQGGQYDEQVTLSNDEAYGLQEAVDEAWSAMLMGTGTDEDEDEEEDDGSGYGDRTVAMWMPPGNFLLVSHADGDQTGELAEMTQEEAAGYVRIIREFEPMDVPPPDEVIDRTTGSWEVNLDEEGQVHVWRINDAKNVVGVVMEWDDALAAANSFEQLGAR